MQSRSTSARMRRIEALLKLRSSGALVGFGQVAAEKLRRHDGVGHRMFCLALVAVEDHGLARIVAGLAANLREESREAVVVVHRPAVEGMVVALGALNAHAEEDLGGVLRQF